jgi:hypothetical protein
MNQPNLFIVGAPKCGTTSLHFYLNQHPDIFLCEPKEPNYYNTDLIRANRISSEDYFGLFKDAKTKYIGEATPLYLMSKDAPLKIKKACPNAKIILCIRKPVDLLFSAYFQNKYNLIEEASTFEEALEDQENRKKTLKNTKTGEPIDRLIYSRFVDFTAQISLYFEVFGRDNVYVIIFDDLKKKTELEVRKVLRFLNVDEQAEINFLIQNAYKINKSQVAAKLIHSPPSALRKIVRLILPKSITNRIYKTLKQLNTEKKKKSAIKPETKNTLTKEYLPEVERLEKLLKVDLSHWKS